METKIHKNKPKHENKPSNYIYRSGETTAEVLRECRSTTNSNHINTGQSSSNPATELRGDELLSGKPFFDIILAKSHVNPRCQMTIPSKLHPLLPGCEVPMDVTIGGRTWEMTCMEANKNTQVTIDRPSWRAFVDDNNLKVGDGCVFELMECSSTKLVFRAQILRGDIPAELLDKYSGEDGENPILID